MTIKEYPQDVLAAQTTGYWSGAANEIIVGRLRAALAEEDLNPKVHERMHDGIDAASRP
ncbi:hypothetical protein [Micromonospora sp. NPDC047730]|uniref:hypothetical protein n=1 Tax=Micromonospora sp. NPDC047730 TaxID=3364253 RepID=UPI0037241790